MKPKTLSASAIEVYEACPARFKAEYIDRVAQPSGNAALLGTVCHDALERWVLEEHHIKESPLSTLLNLLEICWWDHFDSKDPSLYSQAVEMLTNWHGRQDWQDRVVLMAEVKERFELTVPGHSEPILVTYIWDRCDDLPVEDAIEVVDYKSYGRPLSPDILKERIQPRLYALAAFIKFKDRNPKEIWVTFDLLRYDQISVCFSREDCIETWKYLQRIAQRILADDGTDERLNSTCHWCARQGACETLHSHASGGGILAVNTIEEAAARRAAADGAIKALMSQKTELDAFIFEYFEKNEIHPKEGVRTDEVHVTLGGKKIRKFSQQKAGEILGPELMAEHGTVTLKVLDDLMKTNKLTEDQKERLNKIITKSLGSPYVQTKPISAFDQE